jgi:hypothetical protein
VFAGADGLALYLNRFEGKPKLARCQQALARVFAGCPYQDLQGCWFPDVYRLFADIEFPDPWPGFQDMEFAHPYPTKLKEISELALFEIAWETANCASFVERRAFMPPMPPPSVFGMKSFASAEVYRSWRPGQKGVVFDGTVGIVIKDSAGIERGGVRWHWWGPQSSRSDFHLIARDGIGWFRIMMDVQPTMPTAPVPILGPVIDRLSTRECEACFSGMREIAPVDEEAGQCAPAMHPPRRPSPSSWPW